jgi:hypothetical protein
MPPEIFKSLARFETAHPALFPGVTPSGCDPRPLLPQRLKERGDEGTRTPDILLAKQALYQLSYVPAGS